MSNFSTSLCQQHNNVFFKETGGLSCIMSNVYTDCVGTRCTLPLAIAFSHIYTVLNIMMPISRQTIIIQLQKLTQGTVYFPCLTVK